MNFALSAIIIVLLLLPGATAINAYYTSLVARQSNIAIPFNELLLKGLVISLIIHSSACCTIIYGLHKEISLELIYEITSGKDLKTSNKDLSLSFLDFSLYSAILIIGAWFSAKIFKKIVQQNNFDLNWFSLRNSNYWYIVFSARYLEGRNVKGKQVDTDLIVLDVLTNTNIIYSGILIDFNYSPQKDELENLILDSTVKRGFIQTEEEKLTHKEHSTGIPCLIPGDAFVIPINTIVNININYIEIETMAAPNQPA
jgi:hypothetical protein